MKIKLLDQAETDLLAIVEYYSKINYKLAEAFYQDLLIIEQVLLSNPLAFQVRYSGVRGVPLKNFPHILYYQVIDDTLIIILIISTRQSPKVHKKVLKKRK